MSAEVCEHENFKDACPLCIGVRRSLTRKGFVIGLALLLFGCPPGTKTTVDFTVKVGADTCHDAGVAPPDEDSAILDCVKASGEGSVRVVFPKTLWLRMQAPRTEGK